MVYLCFFIAFIVIFSASFLLYANGADFLVAKVGEKYKDYMALPIILIFFVAMVITSFLWKGNALVDPNILSVLAMGVGATAISIFGIFSKNKCLLSLVVLGAIAACMIAEQDQNTLAYERLPQIYAKIIIGAAWFLLATAYPIFSRVNGLLGAYTIMVLLGIFTIYMLGGVSQFEFLAILFFMAALIPYAIYNAYPSKIDMSSAGVCSIGFVLGWILQRCCEEGMSLPVEILLSWVWVEAVLFVLNIITKKDEEYRTALWIEGLGNAENCRRIIGICVKVQVLMILLSFMQMYVVVSFALPIFSALVVLWGMGKFAYSNGKTFSEINSEIAEHAKNEYKEFMDIWRKIKK